MNAADLLSYQKIAEQFKLISGDRVHVCSQAVKRCEAKLKHPPSVMKDELSTLVNIRREVGLARVQKVSKHRMSSWHRKVQSIALQNRYLLKDRGDRSLKTYLNEASLELYSFLKEKKDSKMKAHEKLVLELEELELQVKKIAEMLKGYQKLLAAGRAHEKIDQQIPKKLLEACTIQKKRLISYIHDHLIER